ncbi:hypothetical protein FOXG_15711 [Fusarium oxysporum f. sp. lycopersici 4287]|uniref:Uncharacterized protein n=1 Tax=Fusarium oxysporum f. sp. lycopersici (strain 4287 / CBS 123668 / FGSC 9935 / NRRL 34936) TaxID=426428 RepID=A0A0J9W4S3_FUSO4|nr:hypothetical protein FOXG_15711 [Fusarium oxysporum f. sp. lycopersici 4287]KNB18064.1 hypothetical protein FOXG_15711 [Fusarium oxysporum f. sp. lycopersici 4287]
MHAPAGQGIYEAQIPHLKTTTQLAFFFYHFITTKTKKPCVKRLKKTETNRRSRVRTAACNPRLRDLHRVLPISLNITSRPSPSPLLNRNMTLITGEPSPLNLSSDYGLRTSGFTVHMDDSCISLY